MSLPGGSHRENILGILRLSLHRFTLNFTSAQVPFYFCVNCRVISLKKHHSCFLEVNGFVDTLFHTDLKSGGVKKQTNQIFQFGLCTPSSPTVFFLLLFYSQTPDTVGYCITKSITPIPDSQSETSLEPFSQSVTVMWLHLLQKVAD